MEAASLTILANIVPLPAGAAVPAAPQTGGEAGSSAFGEIVREVLERTAQESTSASLPPLQVQTSKSKDITPQAGLPYLSNVSRKSQSELPSPDDGQLGLLATLVATIGSAQGKDAPAVQTAPSSEDAVDDAKVAITSEQTIGDDSAAIAACQSNAAVFGAADLLAGQTAAKLPAVAQGTQMDFKEPGVTSNIAGVFAEDIAGAAQPGSKADPQSAVTAHVADRELRDTSKPKPVDSQAEAYTISSVLEQVAQLQSDRSDATPPAISIASKPASLTIRDSLKETHLPPVASSPFEPANLHRPQPAAEFAKSLARTEGNEVDAAQNSGSEHSSAQKDNSSKGHYAPEDGSNESHLPQPNEVADASQTPVPAKDLRSDAPTLPVQSLSCAPAQSQSDGRATTLTSDAPGNPPQAHPAAPLHLADTNRGIGEAQLLQNASHSEMRIAMQTDRLGAVELRARLTGDAVGAAIAVEKRDAHAALAAELPALQQALGEKQLRIDQLSLLQGSLHSTAGDAGAQQNQQERARNASAAGLPAGEDVPAFMPGGSTGDQGAMFDSNGRLSVRA